MRWPAMQSWCKSRNSPPKAATDPGLHQVAAASEFDEFDGLVKLHRWNLLWMWLESETATLFLRYSDIAWALQQCNKICDYMSFCGAASKIFPKQGIWGTQFYTWKLHLPLNDLKNAWWSESDRCEMKLFHRERSKMSQHVLSGCFLGGGFVHFFFHPYLGNA